METHEIVFRGGPYDGTIWTVPRMIQQVQFPRHGETGWHTYELTADVDADGRVVLAYLEE